MDAPSVIQEQFYELFDKLDSQLPHFTDGRIDYTRADISPVLNCYIRNKDRILLLKRSDKVIFLRNQWHVIAGFLDERKQVCDKALEELSEETGITRERITSIELAEPYIMHENARDWQVYPILIDVNTRSVLLDFEHTEHVWATRDELDRYALQPNILRYTKRFLE